MSIEKAFYRRCPACGQLSTVLLSFGYCGHCRHRCDGTCNHPDREAS